LDLLEGMLHIKSQERMISTQIQAHAWMRWWRFSSVDGWMNEVFVSRNRFTPKRYKYTL
jgi:hypothetical protein